MKGMLNVLLGITLVIPIMAQDLRFDATVDSRTVVVGRQFQLSFTATSTQSLSLQTFRPPDFTGFVVLSGPMESSQYQWINGQATSSLSYVYVLVVQKPGKYTIGPASVEYKGTVYSTKPIEVEATQAGTGGSQQPSSSQGTIATDVGENLFLRAVVNKQRVMQGEQFIVAYKLYWRVALENYVVSKAPTFEGFWAEDFEQPRSPELTNEVIDGKQFRAAVIKRTALFATQAGKLKITPLEARCAVQMRRRSSEPFDIFNDPFFNRLRTEEVDIASNALTITVEPLPGSPPAGFEGAIGTYEFAATLDRNEVRTGDPVTLALTVSGTGNIKLVGIPRPLFSADIEAYDPKVSENISREGNIIKGRKTAEYLLIPRNPGERVIEPVTFTYFDLAKNAYVPLRSRRLSITVTPGKEPVAGASLASKEDIQLLGEDIRFLKLDPGSLERSGESTLGGWFSLAMVIPVLMFGTAYAYRKRQESLLGNTSLIRSRKAGREATRRLKSARKLLAAGNTETYHAEISRALFAYVGDRLRIPPSRLSLDTVGDALRGKQVSAESIDRMCSCIERAEFARFAPGRDSRGARQDLLDAAMAAIDEIEKFLNSRS